MSTKARRCFGAGGREERDAVEMFRRGISGRVPSHSMHLKCRTRRDTLRACNRCLSFV
jgi:hypothetical protein